MLDPVLFNQVFEIPARPQDGHGQPGLVQWLLVDEADWHEAELAVLEQPIRRQPADPARPDDQGRLGQLAVASGIQLCPVVGHAARGEVDRAEGQQSQ